MQRQAPASTPQTSGPLWFVYQAAMLVLTAVFLVPWHLCLVFLRRVTHDDLLQRLGRGKAPSRRATTRILLHGSSYGEILSLGSLISSLGATGDDLEVIITCFNRDGKKAAQRLREENPLVVQVQYLPWDVFFLMKRWLGSLHPDLVVTVELELWPAFFQACGELGIPLCVVSARMDPSAERWYKVVGSFSRALISRPDWIFAKDERERQRFISLGARPSNVLALGDLKWCGESAYAVDEDGDLSPVVAGRTVIVAGSTHPPEDLWVAGAYLQLRTSYPELSLVIAPRKVRRCRRLVKNVAALGLKALLWSEVRLGDKPGWEVLVLDEMGWLRRFYAHAAIAVVGGSFVNHGGHNVVEPAALGRPLVIGPSVDNAAGIVSGLNQGKAIRWLGEAGQLTEVLQDLLENREEAHAMGERAKAIVLSHQGIARDYAEALIGLLEGGRKAGHLSKEVLSDA